MILYSVELPLGEPVLEPISRTHWHLQEQFAVRHVTDCGVLESIMLPGWVTDWRSGSSVADVVIPKMGHGTYAGVVLGHDLMYSGWLSKDLADDLFHQGLLLAGVSKWRANLAYAAVRGFGWLGYVNIADDLTGVYAGNREREKFYWGAT